MTDQRATRRTTPTPPLTYTEALVEALAVVPTPTSRRIDLDDALGTKLAEDLLADRDQPPFDRAQMDGYALRRDDLQLDTPLPVSATISAGEAATAALAPGTCVAIATGAPLPDGADTVVQHELSDRADPVRFSALVSRGHAVHPRGADARCGDRVLRAGTRLGAHHLAIAASIGATTPLAIARPTVALFTSGDEIVAATTRPGTHQVRNSNATLLRALLPAMGARLAGVAHLIDESIPTVDALREAMRSNALTVTVGGISAGARDRFVAAIDTLELHTIFRRVRLRPGGPLTLAVNPRSGSLMLALPGNPVSALVCAHLFAWPLLRALSGDPDATLPWIDARLATTVRASAQRQAFRPATIDREGRVQIPAWAGSGDLIHTGDTDGIVELPLIDGDLDADVPVRFLRWAASSW